MAQDLTNTISLRTGVGPLAPPRTAIAPSVAGSARAEKIYDVCVVGAGPVGITVALDAAARGLSVALVEAGRDDPDPPASENSAAEIVEPRRHVPMDIAVRRAFGGTSWLWGGRCVLFDAIDFEGRDFVPHSGWPIGPDDVRPWYEGAAKALDCGDVELDAASPPDERMEYFSRQSKRAFDLRASVAANPLIDVHLERTVVGLDFTTDGTGVRGLLTDPSSSRLQAKTYVLACGGLETTRLLLATQRMRPTLFGGADGVLGRYYAGHFEGTIANVVLSDPADIKRFDYHLGPTGAYRRRVLTLLEDRQRAEKIQNIVFWPDNRPFCDPSQKSGIKSFIYLLASTPRIGPRLLSEGIRLGIVGEGPRRYAAHIWNMLRTPIRTSREIFDVIHDRFLSKRRRPGWLMSTHDNSYVLHYRAEQRPDRDSMVSLTDEHDTQGMPRLRVDLRYTESDARSALRAHELLDQSLRSSGRGRLEYLYPEEERVARILEQASDGYHQTGTTRMGVDPAMSIVDANCKVHGLSNLFIASCSVFPTSGHANPTLLATALGARLAAHLACTLQASLDDLRRPTPTLHQISC